ncbi:MAG TPA: glucosamine-6-phosphate deaminase [Chryseolinea sp.]|nr:glucosamine-6-phosphate deaminase [Chryseolinea sp.]
MNIRIAENAYELGKKAGAAAAQAIRQTIASTGAANIILATGTSQFETLKQLVIEDVDWSKVIMFHLDEYIGLPVTHGASFRKYLQEKFISKVSPLKAAYLINGEVDPDGECDRLGKLISRHPIDVALVGIGENGHLAFNDPPADFTTEKPYIIVDLDEPCRRQQLGEGWFKSLEEVPPQAISMSVKQILKARTIICSVPDSRKATAVKNTMEQSISNIYPASILQTHADCQFYLDKNSAALLSKNVSTLL